jgi:hypothetical protein
MDPGSLRTFVVEFTDHLAALGHTDLTMGSYEDAARHFAEWLERSDIALTDVDDKAVACFAGHRCKCTGGIAMSRRSMSVVCADLSASWLSAVSRR